MSTIPWSDDLDAARDEAARTGKLILLEFFSPTCGGCRAMEAMTFTDEEVVRTIERWCVPVQVNTLDEDSKGLVNEHRVPWTPDIRLLDADGDDLHRINGFLPPAEFVPALLTGIAQVRLRNGDDAGAAAIYTDVLSRFPASTAAPEACYYLAVSSYKQSGDRNDLKDGWERLQRDFPNSVWRAKQSFIEGPPGAARPSPADEAEANKAIVRRWVEEGVNGDVDLLDEVLDPEVVDHVGGGAVGVEWWRTMGQKLRTAFPDLRFTIEDMLAEGDRVALRLTMRGTHQGSSMPMLADLPITGKPVVWSHIHFFQLKDRRILAHWAVRDDVTMLRQLTG